VLKGKKAPWGDMDNSLVPDLQDALTAKRPLLPRPASGPFTVDVAGLFDQASRSVCSLVHHPCIGNREAADAPEAPPGHRPARSTR
jgi:hypothetical protein